MTNYQYLNTLKQCAQPNIAAIHKILRSSIQDVENKLTSVEKNYYAPYDNSIAEARQWIFGIRRVIGQVGNICKNGIISDLKTLNKILDENPRINSTSFASIRSTETKCLKIIKDKLERYVPNTFDELADHIKQIIKYMKKYCVPFYDHEIDAPELDTCEFYLKQTKQFNSELDDALILLDSLPHTFFAGKGSGGISLTPYGERLLNRSDCSSAPFLLLFADMCEITRTALQAATRWLTADSVYASYVQLDINDLNRTKDQLTVDQKKHRDATYKTQYKLKHAFAAILRLQTELGNLKTREADGIVNEEILMRELNDLSINIEVKHKHQLDLVKNASNYHPQLMTEQFLDNSEELRILKTRLPMAKRQLANVRKKLDYIENRKTLLSKENDKSKSLQSQLANMEERRIKLVTMMTNNRLAHDRAKRVHLYKTSPDAVKRIFNEQPIEINRLRLPGYRNKTDPFEKACAVIGCNIGGDWPHLYRHLPFFPHRGTATIDHDIQMMTDSRTTIEEVAIRSLDKWRIYHTQAKVGDLQRALIDIKRFDIIKTIETELNPATSPKLAEITIDIEEYLLPCLRQVLRFDQLRALNKI